MQSSSIVISKEKNINQNNPLREICAAAATNRVGDIKELIEQAKEKGIHMDINAGESYFDLGWSAVYLGPCTPLMAAAKNGHYEACVLLIETYGAKVRVLGGRLEDYNALDCAMAWGGNSKLITYLATQYIVQLNPQGKTLDLSSSYINDKDVIGLKIALSIPTEIGQSIVKLVLMLNHVTINDVPSGGITSYGMQALGDIVKQTKSLRLLDLSHTDGIKEIPAFSYLIPALAKNKTLVKLNLKGCQINQTDLRALAAIFKFPRKNAALECIELSTNALALLSKEEQALLPHNNVDEQDYLDPHRINNQNTIYRNHGQVTDDNKEFWNMLLALSISTKEQDLLPDNNVDRQNYLDPNEENQHTVSYHTHVRAIDHVRRLRLIPAKIDVLDLSGATYVDQGRFYNDYSPIANHPQFLRMLRNNITLKKLILRDSNLDDQTVKAMVDALIQNPQASVALDLSCNPKLTNESARVLLALLKKCPQLPVPLLDKCNHIDSSWRDKIASEISTRTTSKTAFATQQQDVPPLAVNIPETLEATAPVKESKEEVEDENTQSSLVSTETSMANESEMQPASEQMATTDSNTQDSTLLFPIEELKLLLSVSKEFEIEKLFDNSIDLNKVEHTWKYWFVEKYIAKRTDPSFETIISNLNTTVAKKLVAKALTKTNLLGSLFGAIFRRERFTLDNALGEQLGGIQPALQTLAAYKNQFIEPNNEGVKELNLKKLILAVLKDKALYEFLTDEKNDNYCEQIYKLCAGLGVAGLDEKIAKSMIDVLKQVQERVQDEKNSHLCHDDSSTIAFISKELPSVINVFIQILDLSRNLEPLIRRYLEPHFIEEPLLIATIVENVFQTVHKTIETREVQCVKDGQTYTTVHKLFEPSIDKERIGVIAHTPAGKLLIEGNLSKQYFVGKENINAKDKQIYCTFKKLAFIDKGFQFKESYFHHFNFENCWFENCDFSNAHFRGKINFSNVIIDCETARTLLPALENSFKDPEYPCELTGGKIILIGNTGDTLSIPVSLKLYVNTDNIAAVQWTGVIATDDRKKLEQMMDNTVPLVDASDSDQSFDENKPEHESEQTATWLTWFKSMHSMAPNLSSMSENATGYINRLYDYMTHPNEQVDQIQRESENEFNEDTKAITDYIAELKNELEQQRQKTSQEIASLRETWGDVTSFQEAQNKTIADIEGALNAVQQELEAIQEEQCEKAKWENFLADNSPQIKLFYQTFVTELSGALLSLFLLKNHLHLLASTENQISTLSGKGSQISHGISTMINAGELMVDNTPEALKKIVETDLETITKAIEYLGTCTQQVLPVLLPVASKVIECAEKINAIPGLGLGCYVVNKGLQKISHYRDKKMLRNSQKPIAALTPSELEKMADAVAKKITIAYRKQSNLLDEISAKKFAKYGVMRVIVNLLNGNISKINNDDNFPLATLKAIRETSVSQDQWKVLGINLRFWVPFAKSKLISCNDKEKGYTESNLYCRSGIYYVDQEGKEHYFSNDKKSPEKKCPLPNMPETFASEVDYMLIEEDEFSLLFKGNVTSEECRGPGLSAAPIVHSSENHEGTKEEIEEKKAQGIEQSRREVPAVSRQEVNVASQKQEKLSEEQEHHGLPVGSSKKEEQRGGSKQMTFSKEQPHLEKAKKKELPHSQQPTLSSINKQEENIFITKTRLNKIEDDIKEAEKKAEKAKEEAEKAKKGVGELTGNVKSLEGKVADLRADLATVKKDKNTEISTLATENEKLKQEINKLKGNPPQIKTDKEFRPENAPQAFNSSTQDRSTYVVCRFYYYANNKGKNQQSSRLENKKDGPQ